MTTVLTIILLVLVVEAVTEILTSSELTEPFRQAWKRYVYPLDVPPRIGFCQYVRVWLDKLISCGYCTSVWVAALFAILAPTWFDDSFVNWLCFVFVLHRLSNWFHVVFELIKKGRVKTHDIEVLLKMKDEPEEEDGSSRKGTTEESAETES